jgi:hypothetical protein
MSIQDGRTPGQVEEGIGRARRVLAGGDPAAIAAYLLDIPEEDVRRVTGDSSSGGGN